MVELIWFMMAAVGFTNVIVESTLFVDLKNWINKKAETTQHLFLKHFLSKVYQMSNCYQCAGFWAGFTVVLISLFCGEVGNNHVSSYIFLPLIGGWASSFLAVIWYYITAIMTKWSGKE